MRKPVIPILICSVLFLSFSPGAGYAHHHHHHYHHHHGGVALAWGLTGLVLGSSLAAFSYRPAPTVVYAPPPVYYPPVYSYAPAIPPGYCRWERYVLDGYGRTLLNGYGQPIKEYTIASCQYPPN